MGGVTRTGRDQGGAAAGAAGDAVDTRSVDGLRQCHRLQDGGELEC